MTVSIKNVKINNSKVTESKIIATAPLEWFDTPDGSTITQSGSYTSAFASKSGSGTVLTRGFISQQPRYNIENINNLPSLKFDGNDFLDGNVAPVSPTNGLTIFAVAKDKGSLYPTSGVMEYIGNFFGIYSNHGNKYFVDAAGAASVSPINVPRVITAIYSQNSVQDSRMYINGVLEENFLGAAGPIGSSNVLSMGRRQDSSATFFKGLIGEVLIYPKRLNQTVLDFLHNYLINRWIA